MKITLLKLISPYNQPPQQKPQIPRPKNKTPSNKPRFPPTQEQSPGKSHAAGNKLFFAIKTGPVF